jgi:hypothetical protein
MSLCGEIAMLDLDDRCLPAAGSHARSANSRRRPQVSDAITLELDRIGWNLRRIAAALEKCRRYPD